jgi:hypothetical protein
MTGVIVLPRRILTSVHPGCHSGRFPPCVDTANAPTNPHRIPTSRHCLFRWGASSRNAPRVLEEGGSARCNGDLQQNGETRRCSRGGGQVAGGLPSTTIFPRLPRRRTASRKPAEPASDPARTRDLRVAVEAHCLAFPLWLPWRLCGQSPRHCTDLPKCEEPAS